MMHANRQQMALAQRDRIRPEDIELDARARKVCRRVTARAEVRRGLDGSATHTHTLLRTDGGVRGLTRIGTEIVDLYNAGADECELREYEVFLRTLLDDLFPASVALSEQELDMADVLADARDEEAEVRRQYDRDNPFCHEQQAEAAAHVAAVAITRARLHARRARQIRANRTLGRGRALELTTEGR